MSEIVFRKAKREDIATLIKFIHLLAAHEERPEAVTITEAALTDLLFGDKAIGYGFVALQSGEPVATALLIQKFSSFRGSRILYIEDIIVSNGARGSGVGTKFMKFLAQKALEWGCDAMEWYAMKYNAGALRFYERLGAQYDDPHAILGFDQKTLRDVARNVSE